MEKNKNEEEGVGDQEKAIPTACVLCAGTSDLPVAEEVAVTLELAEYKVTRLYDVGVAGIHRLLRNQHVLRASDVAICVAGMDGALPGVVVRIPCLVVESRRATFQVSLTCCMEFAQGGLTSSPVIAVPTSVGYGAAFGGLAPLLTMLNACSPGVGVVNIDNGFGAAVLAGTLQLLRLKLGRQLQRGMGIPVANHGSGCTPFQPIIVESTEMLTPQFQSSRVSNVSQYIAMGRKKSPTRKYCAQRYVEPQASRSSSASPEISSLLGDAFASSMRELEAAKQDPVAMDTESSSDSSQLPSPALQGLRTALPIGGDARIGKTSRRKRRSSGGDAVVARQEAAEDSSGEEGEEQEQQEVVTISVAELEKWQQRVIFHVEDHFTSGLKTWLLQEAKQFVHNMEVQLRNQLEEERAVLRAQAEQFVAKTTAENETLRREIEELEQQVHCLEQEVDALKKDKVQSNQQYQGSEQHDNYEGPQQMHSPPNHQTQVQPKNGDVPGNTENLPANGRSDASRNDAIRKDFGGRESSHPPLAAKQITGGTIDHCTSKAINPTSNDDSDMEKSRLELSPANSNLPVSGTLTSQRESHQTLQQTAVSRESSSSAQDQQGRTPTRS
ncbi:unnamed protein product [Phytophthora fragariaefolia]|uniref:phosphoribosylaminoimidazole carboxylase n=1 Tax=Phytophthora fragariaefolia TaxID=1490495 RepID=A0A9W6X0P2_9STRA|nr:unnamed protein product [Phytophthora fragariaefolia]